MYVHNSIYVISCDIINDAYINSIKKNTGLLDPCN